MRGIDGSSHQMEFWQLEEEIASSNSAIIRKYLENNDKVFHAEVHGSPFFLLKTEDEELLPLSLEEVAHATVCFSRAWQISAYE